MEAEEDLSLARQDAKNAKVANSVDPHEAIEKLRPVIADIQNVLKTPAPDIEILQFTPEGPSPTVSARG